MNALNLLLSVISFAVLLAGSLYFGVHGQPAEMGLAVVAGALGVALSNLDKFESFKGAGFEAKLRSAIEEAYATTKSLKSLARVMGKTIFDILAVEDRYAGMGLRGKFESKKRVEAILTELGLEDSEIREIGTFFDAYTRHDHVAVLVELIVKNPDIDDEKKLQAQKLVKFSKSPFSELPFAAPPDEVKQFLEKYGIRDANILEALEDYEHFEFHGELRRPEKWQ